MKKVESEEWRVENFLYLCKLKKKYIPMELKMRLQRMLQIVEEAERTGALSDIERDILLAELREAYSELKFGEVSVERVESEELRVESEELRVESEIEVPIETPIETPIEAPVETPVETPTVVEPAVAEAPTTPIVQPASPKRSALLSLYEDEPTPVLGEQFHEAPSLADTIACPKGVAESAPVASLREAIGVADKFMLIRELFDGDGDAYERAIDNLEAQASLDDCIIYISENYNWRAQSEATQRVMELLQRKFNE